MPAAYEAVRDAMIKKGMKPKDAKRRAAMWWNSTHPDDPNPWNREKKKKGR